MSARTGKQFQKNLLRWYDENHRDLPWRKTRDPYGIWVSEIMLQQTTVKTVWHRWSAFLEKFPDVQTLAFHPVEDILAEWSGLGYYARARNMHRAAVIIAEDLDGRFPETFELLLALPGMGRYTAAAVSSIAFDYPVAVLDANVDRVLTRLDANAENISQPKVKNVLWERSQELLEQKRPGDWNQAMMELGATICLPREPLCSTCPVSDSCKAFVLGTPEAFPVKAAKTPMEEVREVAAIIRIPAKGTESSRKGTESENTARNFKYLLLHRPESGSFARMWETPRDRVEEDENSVDALKRVVQKQTNLTVRKTVPVMKVKHTVMRSKISLTVYDCTVDGTQKESVPVHPEHQDYRWVTLDEWKDLPLATTQKKILEFVEEELHLLLRNQVQAESET